MDSFQSIKQLRELLDSKQISATELCTFYVDRIERLDKRLNSFIATDPQEVLSAAKHADMIIAEDQERPLTGIPIAHKDIFCVKGKETSCCSNMLRSFIAPYDATVVTNIADAGGIYLGKTNMDEFAMGTSNQTSVWGPVRNPWDDRRVPGGSSGGSAAAVAAGLVPAATGSDTGGSIRQPAAFCGVTGFKPTYGRVSRYGMVAFTSSLDHAGTLTLTAEDAKILFEIMTSSDPRDATNVHDNAGAVQPLKYPLTIGYSPSLLTDLEPDLVACVKTARRLLEDMGNTFVEVDVFDPDLALASYYIISCSEASSNLARFDGIRYGPRPESATSVQEHYEQTRSSGFGKEVKRRLFSGAYFLTNGAPENYLAKAQKVRRLVYDLYQSIFQGVDVLLAPTAPTTAFQLLEDHDSTDLYRQDRFTVPANLCGLPAISVPAGFVAGLPVGLQLIGPQFGDEQILELAIRFQRESSWHLQRPPQS